MPPGVNCTFPDYLNSTNHCVSLGNATEAFVNSTLTTQSTTVAVTAASQAASGSPAAFFTLFNGLQLLTVLTYVAPYVNTALRGFLESQEFVKFNFKFLDKYRILPFENKLKGWME